MLSTERKLAPSWDLVSSNFGFVRDNIWQVMYLSFLPALLVSVGVVLMFDGPSLSDLASDNRLGAGAIVLFIAAVWSMLVAPGWVLFQARAVQGEILTPFEAFKGGLRKFVPFIAVSLLIGLLVAAGLLLFIIPGLILIRGFYTAQFYVVDQNLGPIAALKQSYSDSKPVAGWIWGSIGVTFIIYFAATILSYIPVVGHILRQAANYLYIFTPAIRYGEIAKNIPAIKPKLDTNL